MSDKVIIGLAQFPVTDNLEENLARGTVMAEKAALNGAAFVGYTELAFRPFFPQFHWEQKYFQWGEPFHGPTVRHFHEMAKSLRIDCAVNFFERASRGQFYDTTAICRADGQVLGPIRMMHVAEEPGYNEKYYYWPGDTRPTVYDLGDLKLGVAICYDRHFPEYTRALALQGADLIFSPFAGTESDPMALYEIEMQALAFQNQVFVACVNRVGKEPKSTFAGGSFVVSPAGEIIARAERRSSQLLLCELDLALVEEMRLRRPFLRDRRPSVYRDFFP